MSAEPPTPRPAKLPEPTPASSSASSSSASSSSASSSSASSSSASSSSASSSSLAPSSLAPSSPTPSSPTPSSLAPHSLAPSSPASASLAPSSPASASLASASLASASHASRFGPPCEPPWWARGGQLQTLLGHLLPSDAPPLSQGPRFEVVLADGDRLAVHALEGTSDTRVVLVHGLSGDVDSDYMRRTALVAQRLGHHVWAVNLRNAGSGRGLSRRPYHSGAVADLRAVLELSHSRDPHLRRVLVGFSLSGNLALLLAAGVTPQPSRPLPPVSGPPTPTASPSGAPVSTSAALTPHSGAPRPHSAAPSGQPMAHDTRSAAAPPPPAPASSPSPASPAAASIPCEAVLAINPPVDLASAADRTHRGFNRLYELRFVARLRRDIALLARSGLHPTAPIGPFTTLRDLDDRFTAPVSGFASATEYYERCSSLPHLARIRVPTVILTSLDDPLVDATALLTAPLSHTTQLHAERHGGHMGYLSRRAPLHWLDTALRHYLV